MSFVYSHPCIYLSNISVCIVPVKGRDNNICRVQLSMIPIPSGTTTYVVGPDGVFNQRNLGQDL